MHHSLLYQLFALYSLPRRVRRAHRHTIAFRARRGSALITALVFAVIIALTMAAVGTMTVSHYALAHAQADSAAALDLAEAGVNWELHKLTEDKNSFDQTPGMSQPASNIDPALQGAFTVYCSKADGSPWDPAAQGGQVTITCTGVFHNAQRTVRIQAQPTGTFYTTYTTGNTGYTQFLGENDVVNGIAGVDNKFYVKPGLTNKPQLQGLVFNGANAGWATSDPGGYTPTVNSKAPVLDPVDAKVNQMVSGGQNQLAQQNDNALATSNNGPPPIVDNKLKAAGSEVITLHGKPPVNGVVQTANYYLTVLNMTEHSDLAFDTSLGPINVFYIPPTDAQAAGADTSAGGYVRGAHLTPNASLTNHVNMYQSAIGSLDMRANDNGDTMTLGIYAYNTFVDDGDTYSVGGVILNSGINFRGQIVANKITVNSGVQITGERGYFDAPQEYYGFSGNWQELNSEGNYGGANQ